MVLVQADALRAAHFGDPGSVLGVGRERPLRVRFLLHHSNPKQLTATTTEMTRLCGGAPRGERLVNKGPARSLENQKFHMWTALYWRHPVYARLRHATRRRRPTGQRSTITS
jgi:hypothetical protein